jgi:hypothetical protein
VAATIITDLTSKYDALTAANFPDSTRPRLYFGQASLVYAAAQQYPPYTVLTLDRTESERIANLRKMVTYHVSFVTYATDLGDAGQVAACILYNGQAPEAKAGFDNGTLSLTEGRLSCLSADGDPELQQELSKGRSGENVFSARVRLTIEVIIGEGA